MKFQSSGSQPLIRTSTLVVDVIGGERFEMEIRNLKPAAASTLFRSSFREAVKELEWKTVYTKDDEQVRCRERFKVESRVGCAQRSKTNEYNEVIYRAVDGQPVSWDDVE